MKNRQQSKLEQSLALAIKSHQSGALEKAVKLYKKILRKMPTHPDALHYLGIAFHQLGESETAITHIERALAVSPNYPDALNNLGNIYKEIGALEKALSRYKKVLKHWPKHADTHVNMAIVLQETKQRSQALKHVNIAIEIIPEHGPAYFNLAKIQENNEQLELAIESYKKAISIDPSNLEAIKNSAKLLHKSGREKDAIILLEQYLKRNPTNPIAQHMLASFGAADTPERAKDDYVRQVFDRFSASFDNSLERLHYKVPEFINNAVIHTLDQNAVSVNILDIGCGTGLCGPLLKEYATSLTGVDLSSKMLEKAKQRNTYDELHEAELTLYMQTCNRHFDYITCADTFIYFGELRNAFKAAYHALKPAGYLIFSIERHTLNQQNYHLQLHGRYSHHKDYVQQTLRELGFEVQSIDDIVPRFESGEPVKGALVIAQKAITH
ncbi:MAG: tetratricopeptide repeat protein [Paraglaciecola sp.]|uniref:tetratricopeptide repeat protein n=1 Tax=Paraglaciecola sp. TaxID=1920173 RepID=UPI00329837E7